MNHLWSSFEGTWGAVDSDGVYDRLWLQTKLELKTSKNKCSSNRADEEQNSQTSKD